MAVDRPSYRALFAIPGFTRLVTSMLLARLAGQMVSLVIVLLALERFGSAAVAGTATFLDVTPGLIAAPIAGALLDRHGRARLAVIDYVVAGTSLALIALLATTDALTVPLFFLIVAVAGTTRPLSNTGVRTLFPLIVPRELWERANAIDSNGYVIASIFGPAIAGAVVALFGPAAALGVISLVFFGAAVAASRLHDPGGRAPGGSLVRDAWDGLVYVSRHATLRTLAIAISTSNISSGLFFIAVPVLVLRRFGGGAQEVGLLFALMGLAGFVSVLLVGRVPSRGREQLFLTGSMLGWSAVFLLILLGAANPTVVAVAMLCGGIVSGPFDVGLFTVRQRRTDPAWMGRAFAVSMALNFAGFPVGSAIGGVIVNDSIELAFALAIIVNLIAAAITFFGLPRED